MTVQNLTYVFNCITITLINSHGSNEKIFDFTEDVFTFLFIEIRMRSSNNTINENHLMKGTISNQIYIHESDILKDLLQTKFEEIN